MRTGSKWLAAVAVGTLLSTAFATVARAQRSPAPTGVALVANQGGGSATIVDLASGTTATVDVGTGPHEAVISPDGRTGIVTVYGTRESIGHELAVIDLARRALVRKIDMKSFTRPHGAVFLPGNDTLLLVTSEATQRIALVNIARDSVIGEIATRSPLSHLIALTADGRLAYSADPRAGTLTALDIPARAWLRSLPVGQATEGVAVMPNGMEVWVGSNASGTVSVVDTRRWVVTDTLRGFAVPYRLAFTPDGSRALVSDPRMNVLHIVDAATRKILRSAPVAGSPRGIAVTPDGRYALVTVVGSETDETTDGALVVIDMDTMRVAARVAVGIAPDGVAYGTPGSR